MIRLSEAEWKVMNVLWEEAPQTITQLTRRFQETTGWTKHTIMTFLKRMEDKGAVYYEAGVRAKLYYPRIERKEAALQETEEFLERVFAYVEYHGGAEGAFRKGDRRAPRDFKPCRSVLRD